MQEMGAAPGTMAYNQLITAAANAHDLPAAEAVYKEPPRAQGHEKSALRRMNFDLRFIDINWLCYVLLSWRITESWWWNSWRNFVVRSVSKKAAASGDGTASGEANGHLLQQHLERSSEDWGFIRMPAPWLMFFAVKWRCICRMPGGRELQRFGQELSGFFVGALWSDDGPMGQIVLSKFTKCSQNKMEIVQWTSATSLLSVDLWHQAAPFFPRRWYEKMVSRRLEPSSLPVRNLWLCRDHSRQWASEQPQHTKKSYQEKTFCGKNPWRTVNKYESMWEKEMTLKSEHVALPWITSSWVFKHRRTLGHVKLQILDDVRTSWRVMLTA